jgi:mannose-1-phosphate guanylyltransferase
MYAVILAGGGGTRLRPLSTAARPKPFLPLLGDRTLFQRTVDRVREIADGGVAVVTNQLHAPLVRAQAPGVSVLEEPLGRNTAAAIALATVALDAPEDAVMVVLPADQQVADAGAFRAVLADAAAELAHGSFGIARPLVTLGIRVTGPATDYGYLVPDLERRGAGRLMAHPLRRFEEKPDREMAARLAVQPGIAWNAGVFLWQRGAIRAALRDFAPDVFEAVDAAHAAGRLQEAYPAIRSTSIDYAVMEPAARTGRVVMGAMDVGWSDLGTWTALLGALGAPGSGSVVESGVAFTAEPGDLVVAAAGRSWTVRPGDGLATSGAAPVALLRGAREALPIIEALLDRCAVATGA